MNRKEKLVKKVLLLERLEAIKSEKVLYKMIVLTQQERYIVANIYTKSPSELAKKTGMSRPSIYKISERLSKLLTKDEVNKSKIKEAEKK